MDETPTTDIPPEEPDLEEHAIEMVPPLDPPDPFERDTLEDTQDTPPALPDDSPASSEPTLAEDVGHRLAGELDQMAVPADRPTATRDLIHEMMQAGAEDEITTDLLREELPPEEYTEADYEEVSSA
jgi:hypothetical protein